MATTPKEVRDEIVLVLTPTGRDASLTCTFLERSGVKCKACDDFAELIREIQLGAGSAAIAQEALTSENIEQLASLLREQPTWSDFPLMILTARASHTKQYLTDDLLEKLGNVTLVERPMRLQTMISAVLAALRSRRRQYQTRDLIIQREKTLERLKIVAEISNILLTAEKPQAMLDGVFQKLSRQLGFDVYLVYLYDEETKQLHLNASSGITDSVAQKIECINFEQLGIGRFGSIQPIMLERFSFVGPDSSWLRSMGITAFATYPLTAEKEVMGAISFGGRGRGNFSVDELALMETVCNQVAVAMERRRAEERLHDFNHALEQKVRERTAALKETNDQMEAFIYSVSHDLRAPLRAMISFSDIVLTTYGGVLDDEGREYLHRISKSSRYMDSLTNDLLHYSRLSRWEFSLSEISLDDCIATVLYNFHAEIQRTRAVVRANGPFPPVLAHSGPLEQVLSNLISNALKFAKKEEPPMITINAEERSNGYIRVSIKDNGIGIENQYFDRIFRMFERLHGTNAYPGTGMGLAIVKKAIERMGGNLHVESTPGEGSCFSFELRKAQDNPTPQQEEKKHLATV